MFPDISYKTNTQVIIITAFTLPHLSILCFHLLVEICWSSESASTVTDAGLTAADWDTVVLGLFKPACVPPVRVVVNTTAVKLTGE